MALFKCKMCGGTIEFEHGSSVGVCDSCGTKQTLPRLDDDKKANLYDRANHFRRNNEFDKAMGIYETILNEDNTDAEAYWSLVLCRYGIEYVEDPTSRKRVPTVNRAQYTSIFDDEDYKSALHYADAAQRLVYEDEATAINEIQKGILFISQKEEPFDVFICYKETDANGRRTPDSVLANDLYHELTKEGFKVFFARITLEDKLGSAYEPYIFAALNSAKVMVVLGTKAEYFNAVWVKNEWSRYLSLIKSGAKKVLIPAYRDMDPYDLPDEFSHLQAQDMGKLGFMQDLIRGVKKLAQDDPKTVSSQVTASQGECSNISSLVKRGYMALEDGDWDKADEFFERVLDADAESAEAYVGKLMAELQVKAQASLADCKAPFDDRKNYQKAIRFASDALSSELKGYIEQINERNETNRKNSIYSKAVDLMFQSTIEGNEDAIALFKTIPGWKDSDDQIARCQEAIETISAKNEAERIKSEQLAAIRAKKTKKGLFIGGIATASLIVLFTLIIPTIKLICADMQLKKENYEKAMNIYETIENFFGVHDKYVKAFNGIKTEYREQADEYLEDGNDIQAAIYYAKAGDPLYAKSVYDISSLICVKEYTIAGIMSDGSIKYQSDYKFADHSSDIKSNIKSLTGITAFTNKEDSDDFIGVTESGKIKTCTLMGSSESYSFLSSYSNIADVIIGIELFEGYYAIARKTDGDVIRIEETGVNSDDYSGIENWDDMQFIRQYGSSYIYGLDSTGSLHISYEDDPDEKFRISNFTSCEKVVGTRDTMFGLTSDSTMIYSCIYDAPEPTFLYTLTNVVDFDFYRDSPFYYLSVLFEDGTVKEYCCDNDSTDGWEDTHRCDEWRRVTKIEYANGLNGITYDGTVLCSDRTRSEWSHVVDIQAYESDGHSDYDFTVAILDDGSVITSSDGTYYHTEKKSSNYVGVKYSNGSYNDVDDWQLW